MGFQHLVFLLLFYLAGGTVLSLGAVRQSELGRTYFLYHGLGAVGLAVFAYLVTGGTSLSPEARPWFFCFLALATLYSFTAVKSPRVARALFFATAAIYIACLITDVRGWPAPLFVGSRVMVTVSALLSSLLLGFSMAAMLLGHWYLVQPKLSIHELSRVCFLLIALIIVRFLFGTILLFPLLENKPEAEFYRYLFSGNPGIFILMRWAWGLLLPLGLAYLIWGTVKIRSTQSATGILYVAVLSILTGEILSQYLALFHGIVS